MPLPAALRPALLATALALLAATASAQQEIPRRRVVEVAAGVYAATGYASNNMGFIDTPEGVVVIDTGMSPVLGREFLADIRRTTPRPIRYVIFTHYHYDHVDGASVFQAPGVQFVAQENLVRNLRDLKPLERVNQGVLGTVKEAPTVLPDLTYRDTLTLTVGGREIRLYHVLGETDDASLVHLPAEGVMYIGDLNNTNLGSPVMPEGYAEGFVSAVDLIERLKPGVLVAGHGALENTTLGSLVALRAVTTWLMGEVRRCVGEGLTLEQTMGCVRPPEAATGDAQVATWYRISKETYVNRLYKNYTGYWGSNPVYFAPVPAAERSAALAELAGGNDRLLARARDLVAADRYQLALELLEIVVATEPARRDARELRARAFAGLGRSTDGGWYRRAAYFTAAKREQQLAAGSAPD
jgi:glyoxylase-like metal-dependent hydrolase (beta-lactamase superfamily II)